MKRGGKDVRQGGDGGGRTGSIFAVGATMPGVGSYGGKGDEGHGAGGGGGGGAKYTKISTAGSLRNMSKKMAMLKTNELLEQNYKVIQDIRMNLTNFRTDENIDMFSLFRSNLNDLLTIINHAAIMRQMPPIPVQLNTHLADVIVGGMNVVGMPTQGVAAHAGGGGAMMAPMSHGTGGEGGNGSQRKTKGGNAAGSAPPGAQMMMGFPPAEGGQGPGSDGGQGGSHAQGYFNANVVAGGEANRFNGH